MSETTIVLLQASVTALGRLVLATLVMFAACLPVQADAIIQTRAMLSSSIAEYFVEEESVLLELEIGGLDLGAFRNLLPDEIYEQLGHPPRPLAERLMEFFSEDLILAADGGKPLSPRSPRWRRRPDRASDSLRRCAGRVS